MKFFVLLCMLFAAAVLDAASGYLEIEVRDGGIIQGKVLWKSTRPAVQTVPVAPDYQQFCGKTKTIPGSDIGKNGEVPNAVVYLDGIKSGKKRTSPQKVQLDQKNCEYVPHVLVVSPDTELEILNSDPTLHNVHTYKNVAPKPVTIFNLAFPVQGQKVTRKLTESSRILSLCDAGHPWMSAHIFVAEHPYYAVTDTAGSFRLDQVPPGNYTLKLWQEGTPKLENNANTAFLKTAPREASKQVTVSKNQTVTINFEL
jgi:hypothetical protein